MTTRDLALGVVVAGLALGIGGTYYRAISCGHGDSCDAYWAQAAAASSGAVGMGWAWLTKAPSETPARRSNTPRNPD